MVRFNLAIMTGCFLSGAFMMYLYSYFERQPTMYKLGDNRWVNIDKPMSFEGDLDDHHFHQERPDHHVAKQEYNSTRVLCWVLTNPLNHKNKCKAVKETWGKRCNILLFMSSEADDSLPAVALNVPEGRENLWLKTKAAWRYVHQHYQYKADWFLKADDDTYVIIENLRHMVSSYDTEKPYYLGRRFKPYGTYNSGGAGYVFSRETVKRFVKVIADKTRCPEMSAAEDVEVGRCLKKVDVEAGNTLDSRQRERFHPLPPEHHLIPGYLSKDFWLWSYNFHSYKEGPECCSDHSITFHYISPNMMYKLEYFIYHLQAFGN